MKDLNVDYVENFLDSICKQKIFSDILKRRAKLEEFTVFKAFDPIYRDERKHTKILQTILSSKQKTTKSSENGVYERYVLKSFWNYLKKFFDLSVFSVSENDFNKATIRRDECIFIDGRCRLIDIVIHIKNIIIPIEVKIDAKDQSNQCEDYIAYSSKCNNKRPLLFYLTKYGSEPSDISIRKSSPNYQYMKLLSWKDHIINWFKELIEDDNVDVKLKFFIKDFLVKLKNLCEDEDMPYQDKFTEIILKNSNYLIATQEIYNNYNYLRTQCLKNIMSGLKKQIEDYIKTNNLKNKWLSIESDDKRLEDYYYSDCYPYISIKLNATYKSFKFELCFEIDNKGTPYTGICYSHPNNKKITKELNFVNRPNQFWCTWQCIDNGFSELNFKDFKGFEDLFLNTEESKKRRKEFFDTVISGLCFHYQLLNDETKLTWDK